LHAFRNIHGRERNFSCARVNSNGPLVVAENGVPAVLRELPESEQEKVTEKHYEPSEEPI
jgi:hypothetical protein